jgi:signal peptide peptidase SppA
MYDQIINAFNNQVWAIMPDKMEMIMQMLGPRLAGGTIPEFEAAHQRQSLRPQGKVVVLPMVGTMTQRANMMTEHSGMLSTDTFGKMIDQLAGDPSVKSIILDIDSPGGSMFGIEELTQKIRAAAGKKRVVAVANSLMASAAYYTGSAATKVFAAPGSLVGSIGVIMTHIDHSEALAAEGVKYTFVTAGKYKALGNATEPMGEDAMAYMQGLVDDGYNQFLSAVATNRNVSKANVKAEYGQGKVLTPKDALNAGMIDGIRTLDQVVDMELRRQRR